MKNLPLLTQANISSGDVVFVRIDCNVPLNSDGTIADDFRLIAVLPTLGYLRDKGARIIIAGAIGRPKGKRDESLSTSCIANYYSDFFINCDHVGEAVGPVVKDKIKHLEAGDALVLENLRFYSEEESNDDGFALELASLADIYVNDAFGQSHRNQASIVAITKHLPSYAGLCLQSEVEALEKVLNITEHPLVGIVGGAKVSDKLGVLETLIEKCDTLLIGGAMAYTFIKAQGHAIGNSLCEDDYLDKASALLRTDKIILPSDSVIAPNIDSTQTAIAVEIDDTYSGFDIGPSTIEAFSQAIRTAKIILWNGPMGVFEKPQFAKGTKAIGQVVADSNAISIVGGGDSVAAIRSMNLQEAVNHVSTGGGATLEYIESGSLVGVDALINNTK